MTNKSPPTHSQTTINQRTKHRHNNQININGIRNRIEELKNFVRSTKPDTITIQETKLTQEAKTPKCSTTTPYAQTESTNKEVAHHTDQGRHHFHKHKHTQGHQHTQHRTTTDQTTQPR